MVNRSTDPLAIDATPAKHAMTVRHLLTHTAGLTYGGDPDAVSQMYVDRGVHFGVFEGSLETAVDRLAEIPLRFEPGEKWHYSVSLDVLGRILEVVAGRPLDAVFTERIIGPLEMSDTFFEVPLGKRSRLAALYEVQGHSFAEYPVGRGMPGEGPVETLSGGAGLMSTIDDYWRFAEMIRSDGMAQGTRVLSESAVRLMRTNALPGDIASCGEPTFSETPTAGVGFGLGGSVVINPDVTAWRTSQGEYAWGGYASTAFVVDPVRDGVAIFMTQLVPSNTYPRLRGGLRDLVADFLTG
jgi:CubicO group peptidase (beta-lactamase class C family)